MKPQVNTSKALYANQKFDWAWKITYSFTFFREGKKKIGTYYIVCREQKSDQYRFPRTVIASQYWFPRPVNIGFPQRKEKDRYLLYCLPRTEIGPVNIGFRGRNQSHHFSYDHPSHADSGQYDNKRKEERNVTLPSIISNKKLYCIRSDQASHKSRAPKHYRRPEFQPVQQDELEDSGRRSKHNHENGCRGPRLRNQAPLDHQRPLD